MMLRIEQAETPGDVDAAKELIVEYIRSLGIDLSFQGITEELSSFPGEYSPPGGALLLAKVDGQAAGCVAIRRLQGKGACEMKRLYVRPSYRGVSVGRSLAVRAISVSRAMGYDYIKLDTLPSMQQAMRLYESLGFKEVEPYRYNPVRGAHYLELRLR